MKKLVLLVLLGFWFVIYIFMSFDPFEHHHKSDPFQTVRVKIDRLNQVNPKKYLIFKVVRNMGGLGDRMRGLITVFWAAYFSNRIFLIDWIDPRPITETLIPVFYNWTFDGACDDMIHVSDMNSKRDIWEKILNESRHRSERYLCVTTNSPYFNKTEFLELNNNQLRRIALRTLFRPSDVLELMLNVALMSFGLSPGEEFLAIHFRQGGVETKDQVINNLQDAKFFHICALTLTRSFRLPFILLSDTTEGRKSMDRFDPKPMVYGNNTIFHIDKTTTIMNETIHGNFVAFVSWLLISKATCSVISYSGFSESAILFGNSNCWTYANNCTRQSIQTLTYFRRMRHSWDTY